MIRKFFVLSTALFALTVIANHAEAAAINCPGTVPNTDREFTLNTSPSSVCRAFGAGNLNGNNDYVNDVLDGNNYWTTLDKSDDNISGLLPNALTLTGGGGLAGTFSFSSTIWSTYDRIIVALKSGEGQLDPDWAAFELPTNVISGTWAIGGQQSLSHMNLYGHIGGNPDTHTDTPVPEPASLFLFGSGAALAARQMRRRRA